MARFYEKIFVGLLPVFLLACETEPPGDTGIVTPTGEPQVGRGWVTA